ncbi:MAG: hypothetical protein LBS40_06320 [Burkholderiales bacterium]|jgi:hypothetical protein|nr:hypothetical protein [Burkholderiales bacterium]
MKLPNFIYLSAILAVSFLCFGCAATTETKRKTGNAILFKQEVIFSDGKEIVFSFKPEEYWRYLIFFTDFDYKDGHYRFSDDFSYTLTCSSALQEVIGKTCLSYEKVFSQEEVLLKLSDVDEKKRQSNLRYFFSLHGYPLMVVPITDKGDWWSGGFDDVGREYHCLLKIRMGKNDFLNAKLVVKRDHH